MPKSTASRSPPAARARPSTGPWRVAACLGVALAAPLLPASADDTPTPEQACIGVDAPADAVPVRATAAGLATSDGTSVVLAGIAPEQAESAGSEIAAEPDLSLRLLPTAPLDRYGRQAGLVFAPSGGLLQADLVREGAAMVRPETVEEDCARALLAIETEARATGADLWGHSNVIAKASDTSSLLERNGLYALVEGRIVSVGYGSRMVFLDFGRSFRTDFTVLVQGSLVPRLREAGFPVESLAGRIVRVRGIIEESSGPAIRLASPLALELVDVME